MGKEYPFEKGRLQECGSKLLDWITEKMGRVGNIDLRNKGLKRPAPPREEGLGSREKEMFEYAGFYGVTCLAEGYWTI